MGGAEPMRVGDQAAPRSAAGRASVALATWLVRAYQVAFSPLLGPCCRFEPSCSQYAVDAMRRHGVLRGSWIGAKRIARCHPFGGHGIDPVP